MENYFLAFLSPENYKLSFKIYFVLNSMFCTTIIFLIVNFKDYSNLT